MGLTFGWPNADHVPSDSQASAMTNIIPFIKRVAAQAHETEIDLLTAVDAAIRDLRDIARGCDDTVREQADECRRMLEQAFRAAVAGS